MDNQPSFAERTKQMRETAFQLKSAAEVVLAEVQHMEAAQERYAQKAKAKTEAPRLTQKPRRGLAGPLNPNMHIVP
jgi:hypothetical protein